MTDRDVHRRNRAARRRMGALAGTVVLAALSLVAWRLVTPSAPRATAVAQVADLVRLDGRLVLRSAPNRLFTGLIVERYPDGRMKSSSQVSNGLLEGVSEGWYTNGLLQVREHFVAGIAEGPVTKWHPEGVTLSEGMAQAGRLEGLFRRWHANGKLAEDVTLNHGRPHGVSRAWFPSGHPKAEVVLEHGRVIRQQFWQDGEQPALAAASTSASSGRDGSAP